jgi:hypothetical protein
MGSPNFQTDFYCAYDVRGRDNIILMSQNLEELDGKLISGTERQFLLQLHIRKLKREQAAERREAKLMAAAAEMQKVCRLNDLSLLPKTHTRTHARTYTHIRTLAHTRALTFTHARMHTYKHICDKSIPTQLLFKPFAF